MSRYSWLFWPSIQALCGGATTMLLIRAARYDRWSDWLLAVIALILLNRVWWTNMGHRIDRHHDPRAGWQYAAVLGVGTALGAWVWR